MSQCGEYYKKASRPLPSIATQSSRSPELSHKHQHALLFQPVRARCEPQATGGYSPNSRHTPLGCSNVSLGLQQFQTRLIQAIPRWAAAMCPWACNTSNDTCLLPHKPSWPVMTDICAGWFWIRQTLCLPGSGESALQSRWATPTCARQALRYVASFPCS